MAPILSIVGKSGSGKTTLIEKITRALVDRGYKIATVKHHAHAVDIDHPGKDTFRHVAS
jgi:molybdopterin-guanine dinucleotide biosynthesis protein B